MGSTILLKVITPEKLFFEGQVESIIVKTTDGYEGFMVRRAHACKLLAHEGRLKYREPGGDMKQIILEGGFLYMSGDMTIYADEARWPQPEEDTAEKKIKTL